MRRREFAQDALSPADFESYREEHHSDSDKQSDKQTEQREPGRALNQQNGSAKDPTGRPGSEENCGECGDPTLNSGLVSVPTKGTFDRKRCSRFETEPVGLQVQAKQTNVWPDHLELAVFRFKGRVDINRRGW
jgi:hypothetical protein